MIKQTLIVLAMLCFCVPVTTANLTIPNPTDLAADAFADGIDKSMVRTADSIMGFTTYPLDDAEESGVKQTIVDRIIRFASWSIMPFEYASVQQILGITFVIGVFILLMYNLLGVAYCNLSHFTPFGKTFFHIMDGNGSTPILQNYAQNTVFGCVAMSFSPFAVCFVLLFANSIKVMAMTSIASMIAPGEAIPFLYLAMTIMWLLLSLFFGVANIVIMLTGAAAFLMGALYVSDRTRHVSKGWFEYFFGCAMMQPVVVCGVAAVVVIMTEIATEHPIMWAVTGVDIPMYLATIFGATYLAYRLTVGKTKLIRSASRLATKVI